MICLIRALGRHGLRSKLIFSLGAIGRLRTSGGGGGSSPEPLESETPIRDFPLNSILAPYFRQGSFRVFASLDESLLTNFPSLAL